MPVSSLAERSHANETIIGKLENRIQMTVGWLTAAFQGVVLNLLSKRGIFQQKEQRTWAHSAMSKSLLKPSFNDLLASLWVSQATVLMKCALACLHDISTYRLDESFKSCFTLPELLQKRGYRLPTPGHTAFNEYYGCDLDFYRYCATVDTPRGLRFSRAMTHVAEASLRFFEAAYPLQRLTASDLIIDVAGGIGHASAFMAERLKTQRFLVCDYPSVISQGRAQCPSHLSSRIRFEAHDMFEPYDDLDTGVKGARTFFLKQILHDWSDEECIQILSNILDILGRSETLIIVDSVKPEAAKTTISTAMSDLLVMSTFGGHHRTYAEYVALVENACPDAHVQSKFANTGQYDDFLVLEVRNHRGTAQD